MLKPEPRPAAVAPSKPSSPNGTSGEERQAAVVIKKYANRRLYNTETSAYVTLEDLAKMVRLDRDFLVFDAKTGDDLTHQVLTQIIVEQEGRQGGQTLLPVPFLRQLIRFYDDALGRMVPSYLQVSMDMLAKEQDRYRSQFSNVFGTNPYTQNAFGAKALELYQEQARKNLAMFEQAMSMWTPFAGMPAANAENAGHSDGNAAQVAGSQVAGAAPNGHAHGFQSHGFQFGAMPTFQRSPDPEPKPEAEVKPKRAPVAAAPVATANDEIKALKAELAAMQARIEKLGSDQ